MSSIIFNKKNFIITVIMLAAVLTRLVPHLPNFTPITAIALFGGLYISNRLLAYALPLFIMAVSDAFLGFYSITIFVYAAFMIVTLIGTKRKKPSILTIFLGSLSFFIVTNFGVWLTGSYGYTLSGLVNCYILAIPFFGYSLISTLIFSVAIETLIYFYTLRTKNYLN